MSLKAGFSLVETGLIRAKNVAHTMSMNLAIYAVAMMGYWACGFAFMFGGHGPFPAHGRGRIGARTAMGSIGLFRPALGPDRFGSASSWPARPAGASVLAVFVFQAMLADTAATIPTGAMAERWKFKAFLAYGFVASMLIYPVYRLLGLGRRLAGRPGRDVRPGQRPGRPGRLQRGPHDRRD